MVCLSRKEAKWNMTVGCQNIFLVDKTIEPSCAMKWVSIPAPELTNKQFIIKQRNG